MEIILNYVSQNWGFSCLFQGKGAKIDHMDQTQTKMREFNARRKIKAGAHVVIAATELLKKVKLK